MFPEMIYVDSSNVEAVGYDSIAEDLYVQFVGSGLYIYHGVPQGVFDELLSADSKGSYVNRCLRNVYSFSRA